MKNALLCFLAVWSAAALFAQEPTTFSSEPFRLKISAPQGWRLIPDAFPVADYELNDKNLSKLAAKYKNLAIARIVKPVAGNRTISPAVQIFVVPDEGMTPKEYLSSAAADVSTVYEEFQITRKVTDTTLNGIKAAAIETTFITPYSGGRRFPTLSRMWAVPRDKLLFIFTVTGQPDDLKSLTKDIDLILKSIHFENE